MKKIPFLLALLLLLQSCHIYHSGSLSPEAAVATRNKVKIITEDDQHYRFRRLDFQDDRLTGIAKRSSAAAKTFPVIAPEDQKRFVEVDLSEVPIEKIKNRNNTLSTLVPIVSSLTVAYLGLLALVVAVMPPVH